jgi:hypothetical protein
MASTERICHDPEVRVELLLDHSSGVSSRSCLRSLKSQRVGGVVVIWLDRRPTLEIFANQRMSSPTGRWPTCALRLRRLPLIAHVDGQASLEGRLAGHLGHLRIACTAVAPVPMIPTRFAWRSTS